MHLTKNYNVGKMISRGSYTKINIATHNETGVQYSVKSVAKVQLMERPRNIVLLFSYIKIESTSK